MTQTISALVARTQLGQILKRVSKNKDRFLVSRKGEPTAVILGVEDYLNSVVKQPKILTKLQKHAKKTGANKLTLEEINKEIKAFKRGR